MLFASLQNHWKLLFANCSKSIMAVFANAQHCCSCRYDVRNPSHLYLATCGLHHDCFSAKSRIHCNCSCEVVEKGEHGGSWVSLWQRQMAPSVEDCLESHLWGISGPSMEHFHQPWGEIKVDRDLNLEDQRVSSKTIGWLSCMDYCYSDLEVS